MRPRRLFGVAAASALIILAFTTQAFAGVTFQEEPDTAYLNRTTKIDFSAVPDGTTVSQLISPDLALGFDPSVTKGAVPGSWSTWASPPYTESATPAVLKSTLNTLNVTLSVPVKEFGVEIEPSNFATYTFTTYFKLALDGQTFAIVPRALNGTSGARLFAIRSDVAFDSIEIVASGNPNGLAIAQPRFAFGTRTIDYAAASGGTLTGSPSQTVAYGGSCTDVTAIPDPGYAFVTWSDGVTAATRSDTNVVTDQSVTASFAKVILPASITRSPNVSSKTYYRKSGTAKFTLAATIKGWGGSPVAGRWVYLQSSKNGTSWSNTYKIKTTASGRASRYFKVSSRQVRYYRWYVPAVSQVCQSKYSPRTRVTVK